MGDSRKNDRQKVIQLISSLQIGGIEKMIVEMAKEFSINAKVDNTVIIINDNCDNYLLSELRKYVSNLVLLNRKPSSKNIWFIVKLIYYIIKFKANVIHVHNKFSCICAIPAKVLFPWIRLCITIHHPFYGNGKLTLIEKFLHMRVVNSNVAVSKSVFMHCKRMNFRNLTMIYNGINIKLSETKNLGFNSSSTVNLINVARLNPAQKGQDILIKAVAECRKRNINLRCKFVGPLDKNDSKSLEYLKKLISQYGLENEIEFLGERFDIESLLAGSDIYVQPSRCEAFGISVIEAQSKGLPVIVSNIDGLVELVDKECGLTFDNENYMELSERIQQLIYDDSMRIKIVENSRSSVQKFSIKETCKMYLKIYNK